MKNKFMDDEIQTNTLKSYIPPTGDNMKEQTKEKNGLFTETGKTSMGRLLAFVATVTGLVIFAGLSVIAQLKGMDLGANITNGCIWIISAGILGKGLSKFAEKKK